MSKTITGARAIFIVNGKKVAYTNSLNYTVTHDLVPVDVLDQLPPAEYAETGYRVDLSCGTFRVFGQSPMSLGIQPRLEDILTAGEMTVEVHDRLNPDGAPAVFQRVKFASRTGGTDARGVWQETWNFVAIKFSDESGA